MSDSPIRVLIVDDKQSVRYSLSLLLRVFDDMELVAEAWDGYEAISMCALYHPHVILMDLRMPQMNGVLATEAIREAYPSVEVIILTSDPDSRKMQAALSAGAASILRKDASIEEIAQAVRDAVSR